MALTEDRVSLEALKPGATVHGLRPDGPVTVVAAAWHGTSCVTLTYRTGAGEVGEQLVFRDDETTLAIETDVQPFTFDGDPDRFRLVSEARRIRLAYPADRKFSAGLASAAGGVGLRSADGALVDSVGWGTATNAFVETAAAAAPPIAAAPGTSGARNPDGHDTHDNSADFTVDDSPSPGAVN